MRTRRTCTKTHARPTPTTALCGERACSLLACGMGHACVHQRAPARLKTFLQTCMPPPPVRGSSAGMCCANTRIAAAAGAVAAAISPIATRLLLPNRQLCDRVEPLHSERRREHTRAPAERRGAVLLDARVRPRGWCLLACAGGVVACCIHTDACIVACCLHRQSSSHAAVERSRQHGARPVVGRSAWGCQSHGERR